MKKILTVLSLLLLVLLSACTNDAAPDSDKLQITASLFPQYDFARIIGGEHVSVSLLLDPGQESHLYDPSPRDMSKISASDLFIFTGEDMESWASNIASSVGGDVQILDASAGVQFAESDDDEHGHGHGLDPHIWLDFDNAKIMCENICAALIELSPENEDYFRSNLQSYEAELSSLDEEYRTAISASDKTLVFGGRFALGYLVKRYNISYLSAYTSCGSESEPSVRTIQNLSDYVKENNVKAVYCEEMSDPKVARSISNGSAEVLVLHSAENTSKDEREAGITFLDIMRKNLENIRKGLE